MNEIELLRNQLATERRRVREIAGACAALLGAPAPRAGAAPEALSAASTEYLGCVLDWFDRRDERLGELYARLPAGDARGRALAALGPGGRGREALERLAGSGAARERWQAFARFIDDAWDARRGTVEALLASNPRVADWRAIAGIDADSICQERALYARFRAALASGAASAPA